MADFFIFQNDNYFNKIVRMKFSMFVNFQSTAYRIFRDVSVYRQGRLAIERVAVQLDINGMSLRTWRPFNGVLQASKLAPRSSSNVAYNIPIQNSN